MALILRGFPEMTACRISLVALGPRSGREPEIQLPTGIVSNYGATPDRTWDGGKPFSIMYSPIRNMRAHQSFEDPTVIGDAKMEELMGNNEILKTGLLICQILGKRNDAAGRA